MSRKQKLGVLICLIISLLAAATIHLHHMNIPVLQPRGPIAQKEQRLILTALALSLIVIIPVYIMLFGFAWRYRESNQSARYEPEYDHSRVLESIWWGVPIVLISVLAVITWRSSHELDPFKALNSSKPPLTIQAISMRWKWLFIYPDQNIASVNFIQVPVNRPVTFEITSDAPMNSFWIPQLGGQIYSMSGMATHLNLEASQAGTYYGSSANISGDGFAGMHFMVKASSPAGFNQWVKSVKSNDRQLNLASYNQLAAPTENDPASYYGFADAGLFNEVISKYEAPDYFTPATETQ
jgi:cytochrome o ubiquinol oxidase subunit II